MADHEGLGILALVNSRVDSVGPTYPAMPGNDHVRLQHIPGERPASGHQHSKFRKSNAARRTISAMETVERRSRSHQASRHKRMRLRSTRSLPTQTNVI